MKTLLFLSFALLSTFCMAMDNRDPNNYHPASRQAYLGLAPANMTVVAQGNPYYVVNTPVQPWNDMVANGDCFVSMVNGEPVFYLRWSHGVRGKASALRNDVMQIVNALNLPGVYGCVRIPHTDNFLMVPRRPLNNQNNQNQ